MNVNTRLEWYGTQKNPNIWILDCVCGFFNMQVYIIVLYT